MSGIEGLKAIPSITRLSNTVVRILGQNPGQYTLQGTNTYLVGEHNPYILVDTGQGLDDYIPHLREALQDPSRTHRSGESDISDIILTHKHHDHVYGLPSVLTMLRQLWSENPSTSSLPYPPPRIHKFPLPAPGSMFQSVLESVSSLPPDYYVPSPSGDPVHQLQDSQVFQVTTSSADATSSVLCVLHTPGHTDDSLCLYYPEDRALFTADTVLGHGSSVFEDLGKYMSSLRKMIDFGVEGSKYGRVYPGHGHVVVDGLKHVNMYLRHRTTREEQILDVMKKSAPPNEYWTTWTLVKTIYADYPRELWEAAARSVDMHLRKLEGEGRVQFKSGKGEHTEWEFIR
ncbi:Metallo-hydrolase/oxidoreductase [Laetiporus sulphureus 93-53]|uniref:Metallo-hydrolase/oxidoreductase n=1 Tax=Laetiporus sulphureus 93-53 TaxID=1314785 RepID=A0A165HCU9_9APHY|nr:Metallo-hydrolase/oxidoreductase [Laetiporus sulphureus 93-53]KZT11561.1 Metallo-hydrolase/oxidoreductase [Laetiporus sulphureus 93-53]